MKCIEYTIEPFCYLRYLGIFVRRIILYPKVLSTYFIQGSVTSDRMPLLIPTTTPGLYVSLAYEGRQCSVQARFIFSSFLPLEQ